MNESTHPVTAPCVSIVMAVYNGERSLHDTVSSILTQTFKDFEYIIINDGSNDDTQNILEQFSDDRIICLQNERNRGLPYSLNKGVDMARGKYIARIDAGDLAVPQRLERQVAFLESHPDTGILGSACVVIDESGNTQGIKTFPLSDLDVRWRSLFSNPFLHPAVMLRREILIQHDLRYDTSFQTAQDYELWTRLLEHTCGANLQEPLIMYRRSDGSMTTTRRDEQLENHDRVALRTIQRMLPGFHISSEQVRDLREAFAGGNIPRDQREAHQVRLASSYLDLLAAFASTYRGEAGLRTLTRREVSKLAKIVFQKQYRTYWFPVLTRAMPLYPGIPYLLLRRSLRRFLKRLK